MLPMFNETLVSRHFRRSYLKANEVSKSEGTMKVEMHGM